MLDRAQPVFEFGSVRLDPGQGVLLREGQIVHLTPKALNTLAVLVRQGGRVVDKDALIQEVWPETFVEENSLTRNISVWRGARAEEQATIALRQDPNLAEAHLALASAAGTVYRNFDWPRVLDETAIALSLDPNLHLAHTARARALFHYGQFRATEIETEAAAALAGGSSVEDDRMRFYAALHSGRFAEAVTLGETLHNEPMRSRFRPILGWRSITRETRLARSRDCEPRGDAAYPTCGRKRRSRRWKRPSGVMTPRARS